MQASVRDFKDNLSKYLRLVNDGQEVIITSHNKPVARLQATLSPPGDLPEIPGVTWKIGKPDYSGPSDQLAEINGKTLAEIVLENRD